MEQYRIYKCILFHFASYVQQALYTVWHDTTIFPQKKWLKFKFKSGKHKYVPRKKVSCCNKQVYWHWWKLWGKGHMQLAGSWKPLLFFLQCWHFIRKNGRLSHIRLGGSISNSTNVYFWTQSSENMPKLIHHTNPHLHTLKLLKTKTACIQDLPDLNLRQGTDCSEVSKISSLPPCKCQNNNLNQTMPLEN